MPKESLFEKNYLTKNSINPSLSWMGESREFYFYLVGEKGVSKNTQDGYIRDVNRFLSSLKRPLDELVEQDVASFFLEERKKYATSSVARSFMALKVFFRFLKREGKLKGKDPLTYLSSPKVWQLVPDVLTEKEIEKLLEAPNLDTKFGMRDRAILELLYATGLRVSELASLSIYSVDEEGVKVLGKGGKERIVPVGKKALFFLDQYLGKREEGGDALFLNGRGNRMDRIAIWNLVKKYSTAAGLVKKVSPHTLRHSCATHLLDGGADIRIIQDLLGHGSISSTERYTHLSRKKLHERFTAAHPAPLGL